MLYLWRNPNNGSPGAGIGKRGDVTLLISWFFLVVGSVVLSFLVAWQVKTVHPGVIPVVKYNLTVLPLYFLANVALSIGFIRAHEAIRNLPLVVAGQSFMYYVFLLIFSVLLVGDRVSVARALTGFALIAAGAAVLGR
ncbi:hypothetical protein [Desulfofundulus sp.]|uniref:hypothetical protein n=1 Tax=Desulfofundulus sp. TaxID=2282750 RepID=UPI003C7220E9